VSVEKGGSTGLQARETFIHARRGFSPGSSLALPVRLNLRMRLLRCLALLAPIVLAGCHSSFVEATVSNRTAQPLELIEVDYPSASFGTQALAAGADYHYRFKVLGEGKLKVLYTDSNHQDHKADGPSLKEGAEGRLQITVAPDGVHWQNDTRMR
jgi:hypothetical protein